MEQIQEAAASPDRLNGGLRSLAVRLALSNPSAIKTDELASLLDVDLPPSDFRQDHDSDVVLAAVELGRRLAEAQLLTDLPEKISGTANAMDYCNRAFHRLATDAKKEEMHILTLNTKNRVIGTHLISIGTLDASLVHPREVFRPAILDSASSIILVHNHPSGDPTPSKEDLAVTRRLEDAGKLLGIDVLDHIVVASGGAVSIRETR